MGKPLCKLRGSSVKLINRLESAFSQYVSVTMITSSICELRDLFLTSIPGDPYAGPVQELVEQLSLGPLLTLFCDSVVMWDQWEQSLNSPGGPTAGLLMSNLGASDLLQGGASAPGRLWGRA